MVKYEQLVNYMIKLAQRHPNIQYVKAGRDSIILQEADIEFPCLLISPSICTFNERGFMNYQFQLIYFDKLREEQDNTIQVIEDGLIFLMNYIEVLDLEYDVIKGMNIDPIIDSYEGGILIGTQSTITIRNQFNLEKYKSPFYE